MAVIKTLGSKSVEVAVLRAAGYTLSERGKRLHIPKDTAKSRWWKIRERVHEHFGLPFPPKDEKP